MEEKKQQPVNQNFFDAAFQARLGDNKEFKPVTDERAKEILNECLNWHEEVYLPAERITEERKGAPLNYLEQIQLYAELKFK